MEQQFRKIRGETFDAAYRELRQQFGTEAVVVHTSQVTEGGFLGFFGRSMVELTASLPRPSRLASLRQKTLPKASKNHAVTAPAPRPTRIPPPRSEADRARYFEQVVRNAQRRMKQHTPAPPLSDTTREAAPQPSNSEALQALPPETEAQLESKALHEEVQEIRDMLRVLYTEHPETGLPPEFADFYRVLVERGVTRKIAAALVGGVVREGELSILRKPRVFTERLHMELRRMARVNNGLALSAGRRRVAVLCGATGVGKTTNLAKLAAHFAIKERIRVALITADTYRIAATDQLRVYANIIGLPLRIVNDALEMREALDAFQEYDLVLMDTAGGSQFNREQIQELKGMLDVAQPDDVLLVMAANTQLEDLRNVMSNFRCLNPTSLLFTKLDETRRFGTFFNVAVESQLPMSYLSIGQKVPDDIRLASPGGVAGLVLEGRWRRG